MNYKVMGLAPYGSAYHGEKSLEHFRKFDKIVDDKIINQKIFSDVYYSSKAALEGQRFDGIAWGLQTYLEEILIEWINNCSKKYSINDIVLSGGVAQNIKAMQAVAKTRFCQIIMGWSYIRRWFISNRAAWAACKKFSQDRIEGLKSIYLGSKMNNNEVNIELNKNRNKYHIIDTYTPKDVANWINKGNVIARCEGKMEFGQRALGNRSILADPRKIETVERINKKIKYRDFWMPFTPSICNDSCTYYLDNQKEVYSPYMIKRHLI